MNRYARPLIALGLVGLMAACAPAVDDSPSSSPPASSAATMTVEPSESASPSSVASASPSDMAGHDMGSMGDTVEVAMTNFVFDPTEIEVSAGTKVTWTNGDAMTHTVTSGADDTADGTFDSGDIASGESFSYVFEEAGEFPYFCDIHPTMTGVVVVTP